MTMFDLSLDNTDLYAGCEISMIAGKKVLVTPVKVAVSIVGKNAVTLMGAMTERDAITLTGPMTVWAYLIVFHVVLHKFTRIYYDDGRNGSILVAAHG